jgi:hypothetical protein
MIAVATKRAFDVVVDIALATCEAWHDVFAIDGFAPIPFGHWRSIWIRDRLFGWWIYSSYIGHIQSS